MDSTNSTFRRRVILQPPPMQAEALLFNDIIEEKTTALKNTLLEFLQVQSYQKFNVEFNNFLKRTKRIIQEGHRNGSNVSRIVNSTEITPLYYMPSSSLYRPQTTLSVISSNSRNAFRVPEPIELSPRNNLPRNPEISIQPTVQSSQIDTNSSISFRPYGEVIRPNINEEVEEEVLPNTTQPNAFKSSTNNQSSTVSVQKTISERNSYSDVTVIENQLEGSQKDDDSNSVESLLDNAGFKIVFGKTNGSNTSKSNVGNQLNSDNDKLPVSENSEKYLSKWSVNLKLIKSVYKTKVLLAITGSLLNKNQITVEERFHDAGFLEGRKENNLIKTTNGLYRLIGNIIGGFPNELYHVCLEVRGIPRTWRHIVKRLSNTEKNIKNATLNFSLDSPAGPSNITKKKGKSILDKSVTRKSTLFNAYVDNVKQNSNVKRKFSESDLTENHKSKQCKLTKPLPPYMASTPFKTTKKNSMFITPSQIKAQKNKINQKLHRTQNSNNGTPKKEQSLLKNQSTTLLKLKTSEKTPLNSNNRTNSSKQVLGNSTRGHAEIGSKQSSLANKSKQVNKTPENNKSIKSGKIVQHKQPALVNNSKVINKTAKNNKSKKSVREVKNKKNDSSSLKKKTIKNKVTKLKQENKSCSGSKVATEKGKSNKPKIQKKKANISKAEVGLFDNVDYSAYGDISDFDIMAPPKKLTSTSCTETSRSETPPLYGHQWSSSGKSIAISEGPSLLSKSVEAKALKRVKAPKLSLEEELKMSRKSTIKQSVDYKKVTNQINQMLQFGEQYDGNDESFFDSPL